MAKRGKRKTRREKIAESKKSVKQKRRDVEMERKRKAQALNAEIGG